MHEIYCRIFANNLVASELRTEYFNEYKLLIGKIMKIPGVSFSWKRALGITQAKQKIARETGIPLTKAGLERKIGNVIIKSIFGKY